MHTELQHNRILYNNHRRVRVTCTLKLQHQHNINKIHFRQIFLFSGYLLTYFCNILIIYFTTAVRKVTILQCDVTANTDVYVSSYCLAHFVRETQFC